MTVFVGSILYSNVSNWLICRGILHKFKLNLLNGNVVRTLI